MLKGLVLTPPVIGRISIGKIVEKNGQRLPEKDDQFTITTQVQTKEGWIRHPYDETLRKAKDAKLRNIPVNVIFTDPDLSLRANYSLFDRQTGRPLCVGNGEVCRRSTIAGIQTLPCPAPAGCEMAKKGCKPFARLNVRITDEDELGTFVFRTTGFNSIRTLSARLSYFRSVCGNRLATMPLEIRLRGKSTTQSHRAPIFYVDLTVRDGMSMKEAIAHAHAEDEQRKAYGFDQSALDEVAKLGFANGAFEETLEEVPAILEEFFPDDEDSERIENVGETVAIGKASLGDKLALRAANQAKAEA